MPAFRYAFVTCPLDGSVAIATTTIADILQTIRSRSPYVVAIPVDLSTGIQGTHTLEGAVLCAHIALRADMRKSDCTLSGLWLYGSHITGLMQDDIHTADECGIEVTAMEPRAALALSVAKFSRPHKKV